MKLDQNWSTGILNKILISEDIFISNETISLIRTYINTSTNTLVKTKDLWKSLLIDAISILKINDTREKIYEELKKGLVLTRSKFDDIRKTSSFGIDELGVYLDDFVDFESALYGMDKHYRDHINHVFQVWIIGTELLKEHNFQLNDGFVINNDFTFHYNIPNSNKNKNITLSKSEIWAIWIIIALCHDLGYPIEKSSQINKRTKNIISHFGSIQFTELEYNFSILNTFLVEKFLNIISSKVYEKTFLLTNKKEYMTYIQTKYRDKLSKSLEDYKHGIFSSLLIFKNLTYFLETDYYIGNELLKIEDARQFYIRKEILRSIASHTCSKLYHINLNTISFLLILCDELQEWNRPNFESYTNNYAIKDPEVSIQEISFSDVIQKIHIEMKYIDSDIKKEDEEELVRRRFKTLHYLLRSAVDDMSRKIQFQWDIYFTENRLYIFNFDSTKNSFEQLTVNKKDDDNVVEIFQLYK